MIFSRRTLLSTLGLMLPAVAADAATKPRKPTAKAHHVAKAAPHAKPGKTHKVARRRHPAAKPAVKQG